MKTRTYTLPEWYHNPFKKGGVMFVLFCAMWLNSGVWNPAKGQSCDNTLYIMVAQQYQAATTSICALNLKNGQITPVVSSLSGYNTCMALSSDGSTFYYGDPEDVWGRFAPIYQVPKTGGTPTPTQLTQNGPKLGAAPDGRYVYSVYSEVPLGTSTRFFLRRSDLLTGEEKDALVVKPDLTAWYGDADGDVALAGDGRLYHIDGSGRILNIDVANADWGTFVTPGKAVGASIGVAYPFGLDHFFSIAVDGKGNFYAFSSMGIYKIRLDKKPIVASYVTSVDYSALGWSNFQALTVDAASCSSAQIWYSVSGYVYFDKNSNGQKDGDEDGTGQTLYAKLINDDGIVYKVATVDPGSGLFSLSASIPNGNYTVVYSTNNSTSDPGSIPPSGWTPTSPATRSIAVNGADVMNVNFGLFTNAPLPVEFVSFDAKKVEKTVELNWTTANETQSNYYIVERSREAKNFEVIGAVSAKGSSSTKNSYTFIDKSPLIGFNYYRLKQVDLDFRSTYSSVISAYFNNSNNGRLTVIPNPSYSDIQIGLRDAEKGSYRLEMFGPDGQRVYYRDIEVTDRYFQTTIENRFTNGQYFIRISSPKTQDIYLEKVQVLRGY